MFAFREQINFRERGFVKNFCYINFLELIVFKIFAKIFFTKYQKKTDYFINYCTTFKVKMIMNMSTPPLKFFHNLKPINTALNVSMLLTMYLKITANLTGLIINYQSNWKRYLGMKKMSYRNLLQNHYINIHIILSFPS